MVALQLSTFSIDPRVGFQQLHALGGETLTIVVFGLGEPSADIKQIDYVLESLKKNTSHIRNPHAYLITALYNSSSTIDKYYQAAVNYDQTQTLADQALKNMLANYGLGENEICYVERNSARNQGQMESTDSTSTVYLPLAS